MSNASSNWLDLPLSAPRWLLPALFVVCGLALWALWLSAVPRWLLPLPLLLLGLSWRRLRRSPHGTLRFRDDGRILWFDSTTTAEQELRCLEVSTRGPLLLFRLAASSRRLTTIFCRPGNLDATQQRRLSLWLRRFDPNAGGADDAVRTP